MPAIGSRLLFNLDQVIDRTAAPVITTFVIDSTTRRCAAHFRPLPGKTLTDLGVYCSAIAGAPPVYEARLETLTANFPSGNLVAPEARATFTPAAGAWYWLPLNAPYTPVASDPLAVVVAWSSGTVSSTSSATFHYRLSLAMAGASPCPTSFNGASWTSNTGSAPLLAVRYHDGSVHPGLAAVRSVSFTPFNSASSPNEVGNRFVVPARLTADGVALFTRMLAGAQQQVRLYDPTGVQLTDDGKTLLDAARDVPSAGATATVQVPVAPVELSEGAVCLCSQRPVSASNSYQGKLTFADAASRFALLGDAWWVQRTGGGAWIEDVTSAAMIAPRVSSFSGLPAGSPRHPGMCGGLVG